jgi:hypothetical protein
MHINVDADEVQVEVDENELPPLVDSYSEHDVDESDMLPLEPLN